MILRVYHARVHPGQEAEFERLVKVDAVPLMESQPGFLGLHLGRELNGAPEFVLISLWRDLGALKAFAGADWQQPVVLHPDADVLQKTWVEHFITE